MQSGNAQQPRQPPHLGKVPPEHDKRRKTAENFTPAPDVEPARSVIGANAPFIEIFLLGQIIETYVRTGGIAHPRVLSDFAAADRAGSVIENFGFFAHSGYVIRRAKNSTRFVTVNPPRH